MKHLGLYLVAVCIIACGCVQTGRVNTVQYDPKTRQKIETFYSEYFQDITHIADGSVKADMMLTLGKERLPKTYTFQNKRSQFQRSQGDIEGVWEIYFTNESDKPVSFELSGFSEGSFSATLSPQHVIIEPGKYLKTDAVVIMTSIYLRPTFQYVLRYKYQGNEHSMTGTIRRLTMDELNARYDK